MGMVSAAEATLDARIRPDIAELRTRSPYPGRRPHSVPGARIAPRPGADLRERIGDPAAPAPQPVCVVTRGNGAPVRAEGGRARARAAGGARIRVAGPVAARSTESAPLRLTGRGRLVVGVLAFLGAVAVAGLVWLAAASAQTTGQVPHGGGTQGMARVVVGPGQTLWSIASRVDPTSDPRVIIQQIVTDNELSSTTIQVGQVLWVPRG